MFAGNTYPFLSFSDLTCQLDDTGVDVSGFIEPPDSKQTKLRSSDQEPFPIAGKHAELVLVPWRAWKCVYRAIAGGVYISKVPGCLQDVLEDKKLLR